MLSMKKKIVPIRPHPYEAVEFFILFMAAKPTQNEVVKTANQYVALLFYHNDTLKTEKKNWSICIKCARWGDDITQPHTIHTKMQGWHFQIDPPLAPV